MTVSFSRQLVRLLDFPQAAVVDAGARVVRDRTGYVRYLVLLHQVVRSSVPLMEACVHQIELADGPREAIDYLKHHIDDETGHDEWLLQDLKKCGVEREAVLEIAPLNEIAAMVGTQYYLIAHDEPLSLLGYMAALECYPPTPMQLEALRNRLVLPRAAFGTLYGHSADDLVHREELLAFIDRLDLQVRQRRAIVRAGLVALDQVSSALQRLASNPDLLRPEALAR